MFDKKIQEQTEPGSAFLEYPEAQISKNFPLSANHSGRFSAFDVCTGLPTAIRGLTSESLTLKKSNQRIAAQFHFNIK